MFDRFIKHSVHHPGQMLCVVLAILVLAGFAAVRLPIDAVPDVTNVQVQINTAVPALDPETSEINITFPIESAMGAVPDVQEVRSVTRYGLSQVTVVFRPGTDLYRARQLINEVLQNVDLPPGIQPRLGPIATGLGEIYHYTLEMKSPATDPDERLRQLMRLRTLQEWEVKRRLLTVPGVAEVNTIGGHPEAYYVEPDPDAMARYGVHFDDIMRALQENNRNAGGGVVQQTVDQFIIQGEGLVQSLNELRGIPVKRQADLTVVRLQDVARVQADEEIRTGAAVVNGREAVLGTVFMLLGENSRAVSSAVDARVQEIRKTLPDHIELKTYYDRSYLVDGTIATVRENLTLGAMLVIAVLFLLTGNLRAAAITAATIPLSFGCTIIAMYATGVSANLMSLGALDFGLLIDGAVIVIDSCYVAVQHRADQLNRPLTRAEVRQSVAEASIAIRRAAGFGQLIILIVFVPILALTGIEGKMFRPMAATFCFALIAAFLLAFSVIPALAGLLLIGKPRPQNSQRFNLMGTLQQTYAATLKLALRFQKIVLTLAIVLLVTGAMLYARLGGEFIPRLYEGAAAFQFVRPLSISMDASIALEKKSQQLLLEFPEVDRVFARIGTAEIATDAMGVNLADTYIMFRPRSEWPAIDGARRTPSELIAALRSHLEAHIPGQRILVSQPIQLRFNELLEGARADVNLKIFGEDLNVLQNLTRDATRIISAIPGAGEVEPELRGKVPMLVVTPRDAVLREMGLSRAELLDTIEIGMGGKRVGFLYRGLKRFPIYVRLSTERRGDLEKLRRLPVGIEENFTVPLERLATIEFRETYEMIKRDSFRRRGAVLINPRGRDTESLVNAARERIESELDVPPDYYLEWGGNFKNLEQARLTLASLVVLAFLIVLGMIYSVFQDWRRTGLVLLGVPFALVGGVLSLQLYSIPFSVSAGVGFIALFGISILNGIVLMSHYGDMKSAGLAGRELAIQGGIHRLRPVLMTALTDALGFLPMMTATGLGAGVQRPLATVVVGGVMTSTFVILILLPVLHCMFERYLYTDQRNDPLK